VPLQEVGADLGGHPAGDLAHRGQQRQCPGLELDGLVGDPRHAFVEEGLAHRGVGRQVQVGEEDLAFPQVSELGLLGFLHLADDLAPLPDLGGGGGDLGAGPAVLVVGDGGADASAGLDHDG
jgi:hypothetical protein